MKKAFAFLVLAIILLNICGCDIMEKRSTGNNNIVDETSSTKDQSVQHGEDFNPIESNKENKENPSAAESNEYDDENKDIELKKIISEGKVLINLLDFSDNKSAAECESLAMDIMQDWIKPIGFPGYMTYSNGFYGMTFLPKDSYVHQSIDFHFDDDDGKYIDYRVSFTKDFEKINIDRLLLRLKGIYGVKLDEKDFKDRIKLFQDTIDDMEPETFKEYVAYDKDGILIRVVQIYNDNTHYISIASSYNKNK